MYSPWSAFLILPSEKADEKIRKHGSYYVFFKWEFQIKLGKHNSSMQCLKQEININTCKTLPASFPSQKNEKANYIRKLIKK